MSLASIFLARHGETAWTVTGQHTGRTDLPLTERGERNARRLGERLAGQRFSSVLVSPLARTRQTCELAGFGGAASVDADLIEWDYGDYEGKTTAEIRTARPNWQLFRDGCPSGESVAEISARADRVIARLREISGDTLLFSSGHFSRVLAARWLGLDASGGRYFFLGTATLSCLGYEHTTSEPVLRLWNDARHVGD
jgi:probable phosphoglycerate mutase